MSTSNPDETALQTSSNRIAIIGNGLSGYMVTKELLAIQNPPPDFSIVVIEASSFYEGDVRSIHGLMNNGEGPEACSQEKLHHPGVEYVQGTVRTCTETSNGQFHLWIANPRRPGHSQSENTDNEKNVPCNAIIACTGSSYPVLKPGLGAPWDSRRSEVKKYYDHIMKATSVVIAGAGVVGVELAGEISNILDQKEKDTMVKLVCSDDYVLDSTYDLGERKRLTKYIKSKHNVELITNEKIAGDIVYADKKHTYKHEATTEHKTYSMSSGKTVEGNVLIPAYPQSRTTFFNNLSHESSAFDPGGSIVVNPNTLQANLRPLIYAVGCGGGDVRKRNGVNTESIGKQAKVCASNVLSSLQGSSPSVSLKDVDREAHAKIIGFGFGRYSMIPATTLGGSLGTMSRLCGWPFYFPCAPVLGCGFGPYGCCLLPAEGGITGPAQFHLWSQKKTSIPLFSEAKVSKGSRGAGSVVPEGISR